MGLNMAHQFIHTDRVHDLRVHAPDPLQEPEHDAFACGGASPLPFVAPPAAIGFIQFDLALPLSRFQFGDMIQPFAESVIDAGHHFHIKVQILAQAIGGLPWIEALEDPDLPAQPLEALAFPVVPHCT